MEICYCVISKEPVDIERSMFHVIRSSEGKRGLSWLRMNHQLRRENTAGVAVRLFRMKRRECLAGRAQAGGYDDLIMVANAQEHPRACWHFPPRQGRSLKGRPKHATHPAPRVRELVGCVSVVINNHVAFYGNMAVVVLVFAELRWRRWLCAKKSRRGTAMDKKRAGCRRGRERGAGGRARCVWWPRSALLVEEIQRKSRVREWTPQNAPRIRAGVTKKDQKTELKKNQTRRCYAEKTSIFFQTTGRHPPGARCEITEVKTRKY